MSLSENLLKDALAIDTDRAGICDFLLLTFHSNRGPILYRFHDTVYEMLAENCEFSEPTFLTPR